MKEEGAVPVQTALFRRHVSTESVYNGKGNRGRWEKGKQSGRKVKVEEETYPAGQQAGWLPASNPHTCPLAQHMPAKAAPREEQE